VDKNSALPVQSQPIPLTPSCHIQVPETFQLFPESNHTQQRSDQLEKIASENRKFYNLVLTKLTNIEVDIASIKKIQFSSQEGLYELDEIPALPLRVKDDLKTMETWLESAENCTKFRNYLHTVGGKSGEGALREILKKVLNPELTRSINWSGKNEKVEFESLRLRQVITDAARKRFSDLTENSAKCVFINWFRNSKTLTGDPKTVQDASKQ
ncbi:unnamed protein product, partial [Allacma fusca]